MTQINFLNTNSIQIYSYVISFAHLIHFLSNVLSLAHFMFVHYRKAPSFQRDSAIRYLYGKISFVTTNKIV